MLKSLMKGQCVLDDLKAKEVFTQTTVHERIFGWSIIVIGYQDQAEKLEEEVRHPSI